MDLRAYWRDYLVGRDRRVGMELLTNSAAHQDLMRRQVELLDPPETARVLDLGAGTCDLARALDSWGGTGRHSVVAVDYVADALKRGKARLGCTNERVQLNPLVADLSIPMGGQLPLKPSTFDAALASLLIGYVRDSAPLLAAIHEALRPGGTIVVSVPRRDADLSKLYLAMLQEMTPNRVVELFGRSVRDDFTTLSTQFMNDAARLLDFEDAGLFRFWDEQELINDIENAGFEVTHTQKLLGDPPQVWVVSGTKPRA